MTLGGAEPSVWSTLTGEGRLPAADTIAMGITKVLEGVWAEHHSIRKSNLCVLMKSQIDTRGMSQMDSESKSHKPQARDPAPFFSV